MVRDTYVNVPAVESGEEKRVSIAALGEGIIRTLLHTSCGMHHHRATDGAKAARQSRGRKSRGSVC